MSLRHSSYDTKQIADAGTALNSFNPKPFYNVFVLRKCENASQMFGLYALEEFA